MYYNVLDENTDPFPNFNVATVKDRFIVSLQIYQFIKYSCHYIHMHKNG